MDADGDYIPKSVLNGNIRSIAAWAAWKKIKYPSSPADKGIHRPAHVPAKDVTKSA
jgi:hypothetical protein